jgi:L-alanine-DL-glutamate epimerase-like enolase superfamily enzyme
VPIALGESLYSAHSFLEFARADAMRIAQPDVTRLAGVTEYLDVAAFLNVYGVPVVPHAGDMMVLHQHLAAASGPRDDRIEYLPWTLKAYEEPVRMSGSTLLLPETPGASTAIAAGARRDWLVPGTSGRLAA